MKYCAFFFIALGVSFAADFTTGQAARGVIGQATFTRQDPGPAGQSILGGISGIAFADGTLFVADANRVGANPENNRVLIYKDFVNQIYQPMAEIPTDTGLRCPVCGGTANIVLGQPDFTTTTIALTQTGMRTPTAVASDGRILAVADTDNNRILIWNRIPAGNGTPADVVVGQPNFTTATSNLGGGNTPNARGLRGPQGVWIQNGKLFVADTQNHRVLIWNNIPTSNGAPADVVLGQANFSAFVNPDLTVTKVAATANNLLNPVSVTSDGTRLYVTDLGHNRVVIWNSIPTQNQAPADVAIGQPLLDSTTDVDATLANNSSRLCPVQGQDSAGKDIFPIRCAATLDFPRFALSDGKRLFVADGGNNRILVFNTIPANSGTRADVILGQADDLSADDSDPLRISSSDTVRTPLSLAWDGTNLLVSDSFNRRVLVFTAGDSKVTNTGIRNAASQDIFAVGAVTLSGTIKDADTVTITIGTVAYTYKVVATDTFSTVVTNLVNTINAGAGDPLVFARPNTILNAVVLTARQAGDAGNQVALAASVSTAAVIAAATTGSTLGGGQDAAKIAPGTLVSIQGTNFTTQTVSAPDGNTLPTKLGNVQVYFDGNPAPLLFVSPTQINAQVPFEVSDASSVSAYVRTVNPDGSVTITTAVGVPIVPQNPGIFADPGTDPRVALAYHTNSNATGAVSVDGGIKAGDVATITIEDRTYNYTVTADDTLVTVRDQLINAINANADEKLTAYAAGSFTRVRLIAKVPGKDGEGIVYGGSANANGSIIISPLGTATCCSSAAGTRVTEQNPAQPGETITIYATGLGLVQPDAAKSAAVTGQKYTGPVLNDVTSSVDAIAGGKTANVFFAGLKQGAVGVYELQLQLNSDIPTNPQTQLTIAQDIYISNVVIIPVVNPNPPAQ
jgi:hypothetical protein